MSGYDNFHFLFLIFMKSGTFSTSVKLLQCVVLIGMYYRAVFPQLGQTAELLTN